MQSLRCVHRGGFDEVHEGTHSEKTCTFSLPVSSHHRKKLEWIIRCRVVECKIRKKKYFGLQRGRALFVTGSHGLALETLGRKKKQVASKCRSFLSPEYRRNFELFVKLFLGNCGTSPAIWFRLSIIT